MSGVLGLREVEERHARADLVEEALGVGDGQFLVHSRGAVHARRNGAHKEVDVCQGAAQVLALFHAQTTEQTIGLFHGKRKAKKQGISGRNKGTQKQNTSTNTQKM